MWAPTLRGLGIFILGSALVSGSPSGARAQTAGPAETRDTSTVPSIDELSVSEWARLQLQALDSRSSAGGIDERLDRLRAMYFLSVEEGDWMKAAEDSLSHLGPLLPPGSPESVLAEAYRGALKVVRAKHARWPGNKLKHLDRGSEILDGLVNAHPDNLEVRYLRLASYLFLPFFLQRDREVEADLATLSSGLPDNRDAFSPFMYRAVVTFVLENGKLDEETRARLEAILQPTS